MIKGFNHVGIAVKNLDEAVKFFEKTYNARLITRTQYEDQLLESALLQVGDAKLELLGSLTSKGFIAQFIRERGEGIHHISLDVDQFEKVVQEFKSKGLEVLGETENENFKACFIHPKGNYGVLTELVELSQEGSMKKKR